MFNLKYFVFFASIQLIIIVLVVYFVKRYLKIHSSKECSYHDKLKIDLVQNISHEVRTPLTSLIGHVQLLKDISKNFDEIQKDCVERIERGANKLNLLFNDILELSMLENESPLFIEEISTRELIHNIMSSLSFVYTDKQHDINLEVSDFIFEADSKLVEMAIKNIVDNAFKYTPPKKKIVIGVKHDGKMVTFFVQDSGPGISVIDRDRIFERFYRSSNFRNSEISGTGLGLSICKHIAQRHSGEAWVVSVENYGSTFFLTFPLKHNFNKLNKP